MPLKKPVMPTNYPRCLSETANSPLANRDLHVDFSTARIVRGMQCTATSYILTDVNMS